MNTENLEGNKLIAEFMGASRLGNGYEYTISPLSKRYNKIFHNDDLEYHSSWDWLMPVVEKINKLFNPLTKPMFVTTAGTFLNKIYNAITDVDIQKAHEELVEAIKWYNKNNNQ